MRAFISIFILLLVMSTYAQTEKLIAIPTFNNDNKLDTSLWFKWKNELTKKINLPNLQTSTDSFYFRFWTDIQAIDIWTADNKTYFGLVTNYAQRYDKPLLSKGTNKIDKVFSNQISIDSSKARKVFDLINTLSIIGIPADDRIKGWQQGFDGEEFIIETSTPTNYDFKTYWTPRLFVDSLNEARRIQTFVDFLYKDFKLYEYYKKLKLPPGSYRRNGIPGIQIKATKQETFGAKSITDLL